MSLQKKFRRVRLEDSDDEEETRPEALGEGGGAGREEEMGMATQSIRDAEDLAHVHNKYRMAPNFRGLKIS